MKLKEALKREVSARNLKVRKSRYELIQPVIPASSSSILPVSIIAHARTATAEVFQERSQRGVRRDTHGLVEAKGCQRGCVCGHQRHVLLITKST